MANVGYEKRYCELREAVLLVLRDALDKVDTHPCDENNDAVRARGLSKEMRALYNLVNSEPKAERRTSPFMAWLNGQSFQFRNRNQPADLSQAWNSAIFHAIESTRGIFPSASSPELSKASETLQKTLRRILVSLCLTSISPLAGQVKCSVLTPQS